MSGVIVGLNLKYLPWELYVPVMLCLSIFCMYGAITEKCKAKVGNVFLGCLSIIALVMGMKKLIISTGIFAQYLPFVEAFDWALFPIFVILVICIWLYAWLHS
jgi:hypothetical protein